MRVAGENAWLCRRRVATNPEDMMAISAGKDSNINKRGPLNILAYIYQTLKLQGTSLNRHFLSTKYPLRRIADIFFFHKKYLHRDIGIGIEVSVSMAIHLFTSIGIADTFCEYG